MFGIGIGEFMLIMIVALLVVGPDKLPGIARTMAKAYNEFRRAGNDIKKSVREMNIDSAEEVIKGTVDRIVPGRTRRDGPGRGSGGASVSSTSTEETTDTKEPDTKEPGTKEVGDANGTAEPDRGEERSPVLEPVSFEEPAPAGSTQDIPSAAKGTKSTKDAGIAKEAAPATKRATAAKKSTAKKSAAKKSVAKKTAAKKSVTPKHTPKPSAKAAEDGSKGKAGSSGGSET
ncbi:MAG: twin-arginine translocase TatA/TatE family subunit [Proteobacteria bacterium]|nr:twin-arginine translocase TatA/TatE family subunit [Pseudomonadota bacterium]